ncbi:MAG: carboxypeptidase regulatory-like domain-containing protein [Planctomycetia bacterium]|nr:carboxypeptidase regulatory-like domain-containing protein [Planctomycetia bacterium]
MMPVLVGIALAGLSACTPPKPPGITVTGRVLRDGQPLPLDPLLAKGAAAYVRLTFFRYEGDSMVGSNSVDIGPEGTFTLTRLKPGKYKIGVEHYNGGNDLLKSAFTDVNTPITLDLDADKPAFDIDLSQYARKGR